MSVSFLQRNNAPSLAYQIQVGANPSLPTVVFLTGFRSDMGGSKAEFLAGYCAGRGQNYVRFDYRGHGASEGEFEDATIGLWFDDALAVVDQLTSGDIILVGSSMGGWIGLLTALARKDRVRAFLGLAAAPDFTKNIERKVSAEQKHLLATKGRFELGNDYSDEPYPITQKLIDDGAGHCLLHAPVDLSIPVRLMQGMEDSDVDWKTAQRIHDVITGTDKKIHLVDDGDHRLSRPQDLELLATIVAELSDG